MQITTIRKLHTSTMFVVSDNIQKMLHTDSVRKVHKKEGHIHDSSNSFITTIIQECKHAFQFLREEMEPIRMLSHTAAGIIYSGESQEQKGYYNRWKPRMQGINNNFNVTSTKLCYNPSKASAQKACSKNSRVKK